MLFAVSRNGMMCCPFHDDRNPSMKVDNRYHCFGCGEDGDVIDFVSKLFGLSLKDAAIRIASEFGISYDGTVHRTEPGIVAEKRKAEERFKKAERRCFDILTDYYKLLREWRREFAPHSHDETPDPRFFEALQNIDYIDYLCDEFISMSNEEKEEMAMENNSGSITEQNINDFNNDLKLNKNGDSLSQENALEEKDSSKIRKKLKKDKENSSSNQTIKFRNTKKVLSNNYTETNTNTNADLIQRTERILQKRKRNSFKRVSTIDNVEEIVHLEEVTQLTTRQKLSHFFETNNRLFYIRIIVSILNTLSFIYYIICTYKNSLYKSLNYIDFVICISVIIEHVINILLAHHLCKFLFSFESIINFFIEIPPFFSLLCNDYITNKFYRFINITRVFRLTKCYIIMDIYQHGEKSVKSQILNIILSILLIIFTFAGVVQMFDLENVIDQLKIAYLPETHYYLNHRKQYHHYVYFIIVSLTTVGYGDITPISILAKFTMVVFVFFILAVIPSQTDELINLSNAQTIYERKEYISNPDIPFVVLLGNIELDILKSFCEEYFHSDHGQFYRHLVILMNEYPSKAFEYFLLENDNTKFIYSTTKKC